MKKNVIIIILLLIIAGLIAFIAVDKRVVFHSEPPAADSAQTDVKEETDSQNSGESQNPPEQPLQNEYTVAIDPGHQSHGNSEKEAVGPGASEMKAKVSSGTAGISTGTPEYKVNLQVSLKLKDELIKRGYNVIMTRETDDINISNSERAQVANEAQAGAFVRIHCNGSDNHGVNGALTMCQTAGNPYCGQIYAQSRKLSDCVLESLCKSTGANSQGVIETDTMSGINWAMVPVTIVEMGYMTNPEEDKLLCSDEYQNKLASGIADGIDAFFADKQ